MVEGCRSATAAWARAVAACRRLQFNEATLWTANRGILSTRAATPARDPALLAEGSSKRPGGVGANGVHERAAAPEAYQLPGDRSFTRRARDGADYRRELIDAAGRVRYRVGEVLFGDRCRQLSRSGDRVAPFRQPAGATGTTARLKAHAGARTRAVEGSWLGGQVEEGGLGLRRVCVLTEAGG